MKTIMIDGFKSEYLQYAPYLDSLTKKYQWGELEVPMGHWGMEEILFKGNSNKIALFYKTENSSLRWTKYFSWLENFGDFGRLIIDSIINSIRLIKRQELFRTGRIPLNQLWKFDFCIDKHFSKIKGIERKYFNELDATAHKYGTKSKEVIKAIKKIDKKISKEEFDLIYSDHGMMDIIKEISVPISENCFIDSDMARYWGNEEGMEKIKEKLSLKDGKIIQGVDKRFGDLIFLVNTGVLISPNFWQGNEKAKAMHGYDGKHKDMKGVYILKKQGKQKNIDVKMLHEIIINRS